MMSVDPPRSDRDSGGDLPDPSENAANAGEPQASVPRTASTETLTDHPGHLPKRVGPYHIKRLIASGGMGAVYEAVQEHPRRTVALKVMKRGIASRSAMRRFEYESQILARLRHPGIAHVYEAGTHEDPGCPGEPVPFFAMEYIPNAKPITAFAKEQKLATRKRLELFAQVCDAVQHGHQKGIIHRDLKPGNILVDSHSQVKIIDFGVARGTDSDLAVTTLQTDIGQLIGTLQYMSPEQCQADPHDIDTRSDVYALGVVLYELLCERLPYNVTRMAMHEATRVIREEQPTKLSTLNRTLRGDVETIVLKALEKDRERRYQSATDFREDIRRCLNNEAIIARRPSMIYQLRVAVRRNKTLFSAIAVIFLILVGATIASTMQYLKAEAAREEALAQEQVARANAEKAIQSVRRLALQLQGTTEFGPRLEQPDAGLLFREALTMRRELCGEEHVDVAQSLHELGSFLARKRRDFATAEPLLGEALAMRRKLLGNEHLDVAETLEEWAYLLQRKDDYDQAVAAYRKALEIRKKLLGDEHLDVALSMHGLAGMLSSRGDKAEAARLYLDVVTIAKKVCGDDHSDVFWVLFFVQKSLTEDGDYAEAERLCREALAIADKFGPGYDYGSVKPRWWDPWSFTHSDARDRWTRRLLLDLRLIACYQGNLAEAANLTEQALDIRGVGSTPDDSFENRAYYGNCLSKHHQFEAAQRELLALYKDMGDLWGTDLTDPHYPQWRIHVRRTVELLVDLYESWDTVEPGKGYADKAAEWRAKLPADDDSNSGEESTP